MPYPKLPLTERQRQYRVARRIRRATERNRGIRLDAADTKALWFAFLDQWGPLLVKPKEPKD